jgi:hypothetical protein
VQFPLARAYAEFEAADMICRRAAALFDTGQECGADANMAKLLASEAGWHAAEATMRPMAALPLPANTTSSAMARDSLLPDAAELDQSDPCLYRPARARHAKVVLNTSNIACGEGSGQRAYFLSPRFTTEA